MSRLRLALTLMGVCSLALGLIGPASAGARTHSKYGGTLVVGLSGGEPTSLDPVLSTGLSSSEILYPICAKLYERGAGVQLFPWLASSLPVLSKDKRSYTIQLRQGVLFNDGTPFNAQAVVTSVQRFITYPGSQRTADYEAVDSVTASGPYTVVFHLKARDSSFLANPYVLSPTQLATVGSNNPVTEPVCVGAFMFDHRVVGDNVTVIKSPYYYDRKDVFLDKIVFKPMPDPVAAADALKAGDIQALDSVSPTQLPGLEQTPSVRVIDSPQHGWQGVVINIGNKNGTTNLPYSNVGSPLASSAVLRQAFEEAIDRTTLNRVVFGGLNQPSCTPIAPTNTGWFNATKVPCTPYDPADAKKLVARSGFANPTVHLLTPNSGDNLLLAQFIQAQEAAVGINVVIDATDAATANARALAGSYDAYLFGIFSGPTDPNGFIFPYLQTSGGRNYSGYSNPRLDLILSNGLKATGTTARSTLYHVAQQIIASDRPIIYLYNRLGFQATSANLAGVRLINGGAGTTIVNAQFK